MTTARDLVITAVDAAPEHPLDQGELSLALAGAELLDLVAAGSLTLDGDLIAPGPDTDTDDPVLAAAATSLVRNPPYERVEDWLWRRGEGLATAYLADLDASGQLLRPRRRTPLRASRVAVADSAQRRQAADRWAAGERVLLALAAAAGIRGGKPAPPSGEGDTAETVLGAVDDAVTELKAVRQRRDIEQAAFDNIWRGY